MLFTLGDRNENGDVVDLLVTCHRRVLEHLVLARRLANAPTSTSPASIRAAATRVHAFFAVAFPLHRLDEEEDIFPRLLGRSDALDVAIGALLADHDAHEPRVATIVEICELVARDPAQLHANAARLADSTRALEADLVAHTQLEKRTVFPAIAMMSAHERQEIVDRMHARRDHTHAS